MQNYSIVAKWWWRQGFSLPPVRRQGYSPKWKPAKLADEVVSVFAGSSQV